MISTRSVDMGMDAADARGLACSGPAHRAPRCTSPAPAAAAPPQRTCLSLSRRGQLVTAAGSAAPFVGDIGALAATPADLRVGVWGCRVAVPMNATRDGSSRPCSCPRTLRPSDMTRRTRIGLPLARRRRRPAGLRRQTPSPEPQEAPRYHARPSFPGALCIVTWTSALRLTRFGCNRRYARRPALAACGDNGARARGKQRRRVVTRRRVRSHHP
jgi:hypothetical protein